MSMTTNRDDVHQVLAHRSNPLDDANEYFAIGLPGLYLAICSGDIGYWPSGDRACSECMAEPRDLESLALLREAWCVAFVKSIINPADERLPFHHAVCITAFTAIDHRLDESRGRKLHRFLNGALYECFSEDSVRRAAALVAKARMHKLIGCLCDAIGSVNDNLATRAGQPAQASFVYVYRGVEESTQQALAALRPGERRVFPEFLVVSLNQGNASRFAGPSGTILRFKVPREMAARISRWTMTGRDSEVLITCSAIAIFKGMTAQPDGPRLVELEVVEKLAADGSVPIFRFRPGHGDHDGQSHLDTSRATSFDEVGATERPPDITESVDGREVLYFAEHWAPPCQLAADNPIGLPLSAVVGNSSQQRR